MADRSELIDFYRSYGEATFVGEEPAYADVCRDLGEYPDLVDLIAAHDPRARQPNLLFAAAHYLLLGGLEHPLANLYAGKSEAAAMPLFADLVLSHRDEMNNLLASRRTQTNEVGRCSVLALMLGDAQRRAEEPLAWIDLGASGGLNLNVDCFRIDYTMDDGTRSTGPDSSHVRLRCAVRVGEPVIEPDHAHIAWRVGVDQVPVDTTDPDQARWLQACLWPSKTERHDRLAAAIGVARALPPDVIRGDAVEGLAAAIGRAPTDTALVITTSWVWYYLPEATKQAVLELLRSCDRRVYWYSLEARGVVAAFGQPLEREAIESVIGRVELGGGRPDTAAVLGLCHAHGTWLHWH